MPIKSARQTPAQVHETLATVDVVKPELSSLRKRGRPRGTTKASAKVHTTLRLDPDVLDAIKERGAGWQTRINDLLRADIEAGRHVNV